MSTPTLLLCTVGGSPEPIVASLQRWRPDRVLFIPSRDTRDQVSRIVSLAGGEGWALGEGAYDLCPLPDSQDFSGCVRQLHELNDEVERWLARSDQHRVVVDFTGGTKCMSAALAVQASRWKCTFCYVGGTERTKDNVGIVVSGREQVLHAVNPWDVLGFQAVQEATALFDQGAYAAAARLLDTTLRKVQQPDRKAELNAVKLLAEAYDAWDRFEHTAADRALSGVQKAASQLQAVFAYRRRTQELLELVAMHRSHLAGLDASQGPSVALVKDLLANAERRIREGRLDDAVARLYRSIEALAQARLRADHDIPDTGHLPLDRIPEPLRGEFLAAARDGIAKIGLQDSYRLLELLSDPLGGRFRGLGLADREKSPLVSRNHSILAHGFQPVSEKACRQLWQSSMELAELAPADLPRFPRLG